MKRTLDDLGAGYTDEELPVLIGVLEKNGAAYTASVLARLLRERDEAREAARVMADAMTRDRNSYWGDYHQEMFLRARGYER